jgi:hypothetical protein
MPLSSRTAPSRMEESRAHVTTAEDQATSAMSDPSRAVSIRKVAEEGTTDVAPAVEGSGMESTAVGAVTAAHHQGAGFRPPH